MNRRSALVVVDYQNDFLRGGSLAVPNADDLMGRINHNLARARGYHCPIAFTRCWHPSTHCSFVEQGGPWPRHCVEWTEGADFPQGLAVFDSHLVSKGRDPEREAYSAVGAGLGEWLLSKYVNCIVLCGVATEYCVWETARDVKALGFEVVVDDDGVAGLDSADDAKHQMWAAGIKILNGSSVI